MSAARQMDDCARLDLALTAYVDGELDPAHVVDLEGHLRQCSGCFERVMLARASRVSLRRTTSRCCPNALRARLTTTIAGERAREAAAAVAGAASVSGMQPQLIQKRYVAGFAAAASVAFALAGYQQHRVRAEAGVAELPVAPMQNDVMAAASVESLLNDLVTQHAQPLPPETTNPEDLPRFDPFVGVPVRRPQFQPFPVDFKGARVHTMRDRRAALLQYTVQGGHRVTVYLFNSQVVPVQKAPVLRPRIVHERPVYVGRISGYSVVAAERSGVGYALATDLSDEESTQLVLAAMQ
ncbi:anti-sigma factor family protein [Chondromyces crocatus]|uniref:Putative zinc-finger domain-containing protein n=1 Tax=Chondromyces crocatus TaxID=52 RepID=A0A0K1ETK4_CHOCO|nr:zf-HC2 domain-containing protein [Chondromyces crocatus]AKT43963.1 uncharacterized protein CMC5_082000 [Chondromyces crocatus]